MFCRSWPRAAGGLSSRAVRVTQLAWACLFLAAPLAAQTWTQLAPVGGPPATRHVQSAIFDDAANQIIVFGGTSGEVDFHDVWALATSGSPQWTSVAAAGPTPAARTGHSAVYDSANSRMIVFGGGCANDVWVLSDANRVNGTPTWTQLNPTGPAPAPRSFHSAVYDPTSNRMMVFGGSGCSSADAYNDVWILSHADGLGGTPAWTQLTPSDGVPAVRERHTAVYDAKSNRMMVFGGASNGSFLNDVWVLSNANGWGGDSAWTRMSPSGTPISARADHTAMYDAKANRMIVFAGQGSAAFDDVWALSNANGLRRTSRWSRFSRAGKSPVAGAEGTAVYDAGSRRVLAVGGDSAGSSPVGAWAVVIPEASATTTTLTASPNPSAYGQTVLLTATVSPAPANQYNLDAVEFDDGGIQLATAQVHAGTSIYTTSTLSAGAHVLTAFFDPSSTDSQVDPSISAIVMQVVNPIPTTTTLTSSVSTSSFGQSVTLTATVSPAAATGNVTFQDGSGSLGSAKLSGGTATLTTSTLSVGTHTLKAVYSGDTNDGASTSTTLTETVSQAATSTALKSSPNPSAYGQSVTLTATVSPATATGSLTFKDGSNTLGASVLSGGTATFTVATLSAGTHVLAAAYGGDANNAASSSATLTQTVNLATTTTTLTSSANPSTIGQSVTLTATVSPSAATGSVTFKDGSNSLGSSTLNGGTATFAVSTLAIGTHALTAAYSGDANDTASTSATLTQTVTLAPTTTTLTSSANPSTFGQSVTLTAAVLPTTATGSITFEDGSTGLGSGTLSGGTATLTVPALSIGSHSLTAVYGGDASDAASKSTVLAQTVLPGQAGALVTSVSALSFSYQLGALAPPLQTLTVSSTNGTLAPFTVSANGGTWLIPGVNSGTTPEPFNVIVNPTGLAPNIYTGTLAISSPGATSVVVNVTLTVTAQVPPQLSVNAPPLSLSGLPGGSQVSTQVLVSNSGGGVLNFTAATSGGNWLSVSPTAGTVDNTAAASTSTSSIALTVTSDPTSLSPGTYQGALTVSGAGATETFPVTFTVALPTPVILVSQAGLSFTAVSQGGAPLAQQLGILNVGTGTLNWAATASTLAGGNWLLISPSSGTVQQPYLDVSLVNVTIDPVVLGSMTPGDYYGLIQIADASVPPAAVNSPQLVTVILSVLPAGSDPGPEVSPSSLIFTGLAGASPKSQSVAIGIRKAGNDQFLSGHIGGGFTYSPASATVLPNQPVSLQVSPDFTALNPGEIDHGTITLQFSNGTARNIGLLTVVAPSAAGHSTIGPQASSNCTNLNLQWRTPAPPNFTVAQGHGQTLELQIVDDCGNLIGPGNPKGASVLATFSNGDANLALVHVGSGVWTGTWKPVNPSTGAVTVAVTAFNVTGQSTQSGQASPLFGTVTPGTTPTVTSGGVLQAASLVPGAPIAPGSLISIYGSNLADAPGQNGTRVLLGDLLLPIFYSSSGQLNVQVPYNIPVNAQSQLSVQRDNILSVPQQLVVASAQPGVFTVNQQGTGAGVIFKSDGVTLAQGATPALVGETAVIYCTGLGAVTPPLLAGAPAPASPPSTTVNPVTVTIAGLNADVSFSGLAPGFAGLYQVNAVVPNGSDAGGANDEVPVTLTVNGHVSPPVTIRRPGPRGGTPGIRSGPPSDK